MKAKFLALAALILGMVSCQTDVVEGLHVDANGEAAVTLQVGLPEDVTRADSALGAIDNGYDVNAYDIRFILEVYDKAGTLAKERMVNSGDETSTSFSFRLVPGREYRFVAWADFVPEGTKDDFHYNTHGEPNGRGLRKIELIGDQNLNDETRDAYTQVVTVENFSGASSIPQMVLKRPFAKLRVITTDMNQLYSNLSSATVEYTSKVYTTFNALDSKVDGEPEYIDAKTISYGDNYANNVYGGPENGEMTLFADYYFAGENDRVMFDLDITDGTGYTIPTIKFNTNIPIQRNHLTTVKGYVLTDANNITVTIVDVFDQPNIDVEYKRAGTAQELVDIIEEINNSTTDEETHIVLSGDIDLSQLITRATASNNVTIASGKEVVLDIQSYNISGTDNGTASFGLFNIQPGAKLTIEGTSGKIQLTATQNRGWNAYSSVISNQRGEFVLNGGTIEHLGGTDMAYGLDILTNTGAGDAKATINGGTVKSPYRAVRQFLNSTKATAELYVNGGTIEGANKSIWMQNANAHNNPGKLNVAKSAELKGDVYVYGSGASVLDIELSVAVDALKNGATVVPSSIPAGYAVYVKNGNWVYENGVAVNGDEVEICNAGGLKWVADQVNSGKDYFAGKTVKLVADIDLNNEAWTPVGQTGATTFNGVFDGQNYTISNLNVNSEAQTGAHYSSGLFGWVESHTAGHGHIKNVKINGATIVGHHNCGALVGYITQETALVENCHVTGATITCTKANNDADGDKAGALIGNATVATPVKNCTAANSTVSAGRDAGQLIGAGKEANVTGCSATDVTVSANGTGTGANVRNEVIGRLL